MAEKIGWGDLTFSRPAFRCLWSNTKKLFLMCSHECFTHHALLLKIQSLKFITDICYAGDGLFNREFVCTGIPSHTEACLVFSFCFLMRIDFFIWTFIYMDIQQHYPHVISETRLQKFPETNSKIGISIQPFDHIILNIVFTDFWN